MKIDGKLNLVTEIQSEVGTIYVHSTPISREIFEEYYLVLSRSFAMIYSKGLHLAAPKIAHLVLKDISEQEGVWRDVETCLVNEIIRLSSVSVPTQDAGYSTGTLSDALARNVISGDEFSEIKGMLVFFTLASSVAKKDLIEPTMMQLGDLWGSWTTRLSSMEFKDSLRKSTEEPILTQSETTVISSVPC